VAVGEGIAISVEHRGDVAVMTVGGVIDLATSSALQEAIDSAISKGLTTLIIDLSEVTFMASIGLAMLDATTERFGRAAKLAVVGKNPATKRPIQLTGLAQRVSLCSTLEEALPRPG